MSNQLHPDDEIDELFRKLQNCLCQWERATGRESLLIFRESERNIAMHGPQPSAVAYSMARPTPSWNAPTRSGRQPMPRSTRRRDVRGAGTSDST